MWDELYSTFQIRGRITYPPYAKRELERYEQELGLRLPKSYREFCFVFGPGGIIPPYPCDIAAPAPEGWETFAESRWLNAYARANAADYAERAEDIARLSRALFFGSDGTTRNFFFWDTGEVTSARDWECAVYVLHRHYETERLAGTFFDFVAKTCVVDGIPGYEPDIERRREFEPALMPFDPITVRPEWRTSTVVALARGMSESRDFSAMPILADALEDAGCGEVAILGACRDPNAGILCGRWAVDLVLGKG